MRAMRLRCPHCGGGPIFTSWSRLLPVCPVCGLGLERGEDGYWLGAYFFNLMAMEAAFSVWVVGFLLETWPNPPWGIFQISTVAFSTFLYLREASVLSRTDENGDSTMLLVRRCFQCSRG